MGILGEDFCFKTKFNRLRQLKTSSRVWEFVVLLQHEYFRQLAHRNNYKCLQIRRDFHLRLLDFYLEQVWQHKHSFLSRVEFHSICGNNGFLAKRIARRFVLGKALWEHCEFRGICVWSSEFLLPNKNGRLFHG